MAGYGKMKGKKKMSKLTGSGKNKATKQKVKYKVPKSKRKMKK